jgi:hypothetical protein
MIAPSNVGQFVNDHRVSLDGVQRFKQAGRERQRRPAKSCKNARPEPVVQHDDARSLPESDCFGMSLDCGQDVEPRRRRRLQDLMKTSGLP